MRVVFEDHAGYPERPGVGGTSDTMWDMASSLKRLGEDAHIVGPYTSKNYPDPNVIVHRYRMPPKAGISNRNIAGVLWMVKRAADAVKKVGEVDVVQCEDYIAAAAIATICRDIPVVLLTPGNVYERIAAYRQISTDQLPFDWSTRPVYKWAARTAAKRCAAIIVVSQEMHKWWAFSGASPDRLKVIPQGVDTEFFRPIPDARARLGLGPNEKIVLYAGRLAVHKGVDYLIKAMPSIRDHVPEVRLHIAGDGLMRRTLQEQVNNAGIGDAVVFHSWIDRQEMPLWYSAADICVLPSFTEAMPRVMFESMACGTLFMGTPISGVVDHIVHRQTGILVRWGRVEGIESSLIEFLTEDKLRDDVAKRGSAYVRDSFSWDTVMKKVLEDVYQPVVSAQRPT